MNSRALTWDLDNIVKVSEYDQLLQSIKADIGELKSWQKHLKSSMSTAEFGKYISFSEASSERLSRASSLPQLAEEADESDATAKALKGKIKDLFLEYSEAAQPILMWFKGLETASKPGLDDKNAKRLFATAKDWQYSLEYARKMAKYSLNEAAENIMINKDANGLSVLIDLRGMIATDQTYKFELPGKKPKIIESQEVLLTHAYSTKAAERKATYEALLGSYKANAAKYFAIYQAVVKDWNYEAKLRGYKSSISIRNVANQVPDRAIEVLMEVCSANTAVFADYFTFKAKALGVKKLTRFDIYAPIDEAKQTYPLEQAIDVVLTTFSEFSPNFGKHAKAIIDAQHVDYLPRKHKRSGAFCATVAPNLAPYVLLNYTEQLRDVSTLAHELGHGVHSCFAAELPISVQQANLPLAETASTLAEMMLFEKLLANTKNPAEKRAMLSDKMGDSYATICRQNFFVKAEIEAHARMSQGLTQPELNEIWLKTLKEQFGDSIEIDPIFGYEWAYIPHIVHTPFYCYAYNFGELLSLALYARYKKEGQSFVPKIEKILAAGGSRDPQEVLREVGIDMCDAKFWQGSFEIIRGWMNELKALS